MLHIPWLSIQGQARLARDCAVNRSTISRLVTNELSPSYALARAVTDSLSKRLGRPLDIREVFSLEGTYPTPRVCDLTEYCHGCFPPEAYDDDGVMRPDYRDLRPGDWCTYRPSDHTAYPANLPS